jgi:hypothetical protein
MHQLPSGLLLNLLRGLNGVIPEEKEKGGSLDSVPGGRWKGRERVGGQ